MIPSLLMPLKGAEMGGRIPFTLAVHSGGTLRMTEGHEQVLAGINGIPVGKGLYQIDGRLSQGGYGVTYHARLHSVAEDATDEERKRLKSRVIVKEMVFEIPEMFLQPETIETYVKGYREDHVVAEGLVDLLRQNPPARVFRRGYDQQRKDERDLAKKIKGQMLAKVPDAIQRQLLQTFLPQHPSSKEDVARGLEAYYASRLQADILSQIPGVETQAKLREALSKDQYGRQAQPSTTQEVQERLSSYAQSSEAATLRSDLDRRKEEFLREVAILKILERNGVEHVPHSIGGLIKIHRGKSGMKNVADIFYAQTEMPGTSLDKFLRRPDASKHDKGQVFTEKFAVQAMIKYLRILEAINEAGFVYRDGKPENTLFDPTNGEVSIVDFGISAPVKASVVSQLRSQGIITDTQPQGTLGYYPPEATRALPVVDARGDTYSAGKLLYAMLTADLQPDDAPPIFISEQLNQVDDNDISPRLKAIIRNAVDAEYDMRYTPAQFRAQLETHLENMPRRK